MEGGVNPAQSDIVRSGPVPSETVIFRREAPPPYSANDSVIQTQPTIIEQVVIVQTSLKDKPTYYHCHECRDRVLTKVKYVNSRKTHLLAGCICGFTAWCLLCCLGAIPYMVTSLKKTEHYCPHCDTLLGTHSKI